MSDKARVRLAYEPGGDNIRMQVLEQEAASFTAEELGDLILALVDARALLKPPVEISDPIGGQKLKLYIAKRWFVDIRPTGNAVLMLLHHGLGWVGIDLDVSGKLRLGNLLTTARALEAAPKPN